jgi:lipoate-protein ligase B
MEYGAALALQESLLAAKVAGDPSDYLLLLEHEPVYTLGRGADAGDLLGAPVRLGVPVFRVGRGGGATFHGPGQLVAYPIIGLRAGSRDVHAYIRRLEETLVAACAAFGVAATTRPGLTGVWTAGEKIASIGIGVRRGIAWHGVALNVSVDLGYFAQITPCRLPEIRMTTLAARCAPPPTLSVVAAAFEREFRRAMGYPCGGPP